MTTDSITPLQLTTEDRLTLASEVATMNLLFAQETLAQRIADPTITTKGLLDIAEHSYKVSGMAKRQEAKDDTGRFIFTIVMGDGQDMRIEKSIGGGAIDESSPAVLLEQANQLAEQDYWPEWEHEA